MYSGILKLNSATDDMIMEVAAASDYFQMAGLKESLDQKFKNQVELSNVFHWAKVADMYNLPQLTSMCDRIQLLKFNHVVKHKEFCELPKDEVLKYITKCKEYSGICNDDLLTAALKWVDNNEPFPELMQQIDLEKCSQGTLKTVGSHPAIPQNICTQNEKHLGIKQGKETLAFITAEKCVVVDQDGEMRQLDEFVVSSEDMDATYSTCYTHNGYVCINEIPTRDYSKAKVSIVKCDAQTQHRENLPGQRMIKTGTDFSVIHKEKLYLIGCIIGSILIYDLKKCVWSKLPLPEECKKHTKFCKGAVVGDDLYFMDNRLHLFRVKENKLERIQTEIKRTKAKKTDSRVPVISLAAVHHRWLYIFTKETGTDKIQVHCYDSALDTCTDAPESFFYVGDKEISAVSTVLLENTIFFAGRVNFFFRDESVLYEYDLCNNLVCKSKRSYPQKAAFHVSAIDVTKRLESYSDIPVYSDTLAPKSGSGDSDNCMYGDSYDDYDDDDYYSDW